MNGVYKICFLMLMIFQSCSVSKKSSGEIKDNIDYFIEAKQVSNLGIDPIGNIFFVTNNRTLNKYTNEGNLDLTFDTQLSGMIHSIDVSNPLYILIYYRDGNKIQLLDRNLAPLEELDLGQWTTNDITAAQISNDNNIWVYDNTDRKLKKYTRSGNLIIESLDIYGMTNMNTNVNHIYEHNNQVFLRNADGKLIVMNNLGKYLKDMDYQVGLPLLGRLQQLCAPMDDRYYCFRLDNTRFQSTIPLRNLQDNSKEAIFYKNELYEVLNGGITKNKITD